MQENDAKPPTQSDYLNTKDIKQGQSRTLSSTPGFYLPAEGQLRANSLPLADTDFAQQCKGCQDWTQ